MRIQNYSIRDVMKGIDGRKMILPALQREFVWKRKDIERLFDSLLQGFPINTLMFWEVDDIMNGVMEYYEFLSSKFQESVSTNSIYQVRDNDSKTIVVDGQQRLTSLWISLYGSYTLEKGKNEMYLYLNLDAPNNTNDSEEDSINSTDSFYNFKFMPEYKYRTCIANGEHWIRVSEAYTQNFNAISYILSNQLVENEFAKETLEKLLGVFKDENIINAYEIQGKDLDHVLNIFVRTNSGGKPLSKGDLLLSVITVNWAGSNNVNAREYVQDIVNKVAKYGYKVDKDWVLSCILYILNKDIKLTVSNFDQSTANEIFNAKDDIANSIEVVCKLLNRYGILERGLTSKLALLPIVYHIFKFKLSAYVSKNYVNGQKQSVDTGLFADMRTWLFRAISTSFFTSGTNEKLKKIQNVQKLHGSKDYYPLSEIIDTDSSLVISDKEISEYMGIEKKVSFPILNIIYSSTDLISYLEPAKGYDVDHVHAAKNFQGLDDKRYDTIPNLQLLGYDENRSKNDMSLSDWWNGKSSTEKDKYLLPTNFSTDISDFDTFFGDREQMLSEILKKKLGVEEKIKTIIRKHINNPSGSLAEFIKKCQSSAALEEDGLKDC